MKVIDHSEFRDEEGVITLENRIRATLQHGLNWYGEIQTQETATERLSKSLGTEHTLLRNVTIPGTSIIVPMILLSPQGIRVLEPSRIKGVFRAKGEDWLKFDSRGRRFKRTKPNLQAEALRKAQLVHRYLQNYLEDQGYKLPDTEAVLLFTDPRTHVDSTRPQIRVVQADAVDHFCANLQEFQPIMDQEDIDILVEALINPRMPEPEPVPQVEVEPEPELDTSDFVVEGEPFTAESKPMIMPLQTVYQISKMPFSTGQWIVLAVMAFFELVILIIIAMLIVRNSFFA